MNDTALDDCWHAYSANSRSCPSSAIVSCAILANNFQHCRLSMTCSFCQERGGTKEERAEANSGIQLPIADPLATDARRERVAEPLASDLWDILSSLAPVSMNRVTAPTLMQSSRLLGQHRSAPLPSKVQPRQSIGACEMQILLLYDCYANIMRLPNGDLALSSAWAGLVVSMTEL